MNSVRWIFTSLFIGLFSTVVAAQSNNISVSHYEPLQRLSIQSANAAISQKIGSSGPVTLNFDALGQSFDLRLESNNGFLSAASRCSSSASQALAADYFVWGRVYSATPLSSGETAPTNPLTGVPAEQIVGDNLIAQVPRNLLKDVPAL